MAGDAPTEPPRASELLEQWFAGDGAKTLGSLNDLLRAGRLRGGLRAAAGGPGPAAPHRGRDPRVRGRSRCCSRCSSWSAARTCGYPQRFRRLELAGGRQQRFIERLMRLIRRLERLSRPAGAVPVQPPGEQHRLRPAGAGGVARGVPGAPLHRPRHAPLAGRGRAVARGDPRRRAGGDRRGRSSEPPGWSSRSSSAAPSCTASAACSERTGAAGSAGGVVAGRVDVALDRGRREPSVRAPAAAGSAAWASSWSRPPAACRRAHRPPPRRRPRALRGRRDPCSPPTPRAPRGPPRSPPRWCPRGPSRRPLPATSRRSRPRSPPGPDGGRARTRCTGRGGTGRRRSRSPARRRACPRGSATGARRAAMPGALTNAPPIDGRPGWVCHLQRRQRIPHGRPPRTSIRRGPRRPSCSTATASFPAAPERTSVAGARVRGRVRAHRARGAVGDRRGDPVQRPREPFDNDAAGGPAARARRPRRRSRGRSRRQGRWRSGRPRSRLFVVGVFVARVFGRAACVRWRWL